MPWRTTALKESSADQGANYYAGCSPRLTQLSSTNVHSSEQGIETKAYVNAQNVEKMREGEEEFEEVILFGVWKMEGLLSNL